MTKKQIIADLRERIATLKQEREEFMTQANLQAAAMSGAIQELETMLTYLTKPKDE